MPPLAIAASIPSKVHGHPSGSHPSAMQIPLTGGSNVLLQTQEFSPSFWPEGHGR
jgi:hypothetical protein